MEDGRSLPLDDEIIDASHATTTWKERALFGPGAWRSRDLGYYDRFDIRVLLDMDMNMDGSQGTDTIGGSSTA